MSSGAAAVSMAMRALGEAGLNTPTSGNVSVREGDSFLISPSSKRWDRMTESDVVAMSPEETHPAGLVPSSEWRLHAAIYREKPHVNAVVHTHSPWATSLSCLRKPLPPIHYAIVLGGADEVPCAEYEPFGSVELSRSVVRSMGEGNAALMASHGLVTAGKSVDDALDLAIEIEWLCRVFLQASAAGQPVLLNRGELDRAREQFRARARSVEE